MMKTPSNAQKTAMRLLQPLQLARQASLIHDSDMIDQESASPGLKANPKLMIEDQEADPDGRSPRELQNPFLSQKDFLQSIFGKNQLGQA